MPAPAPPKLARYLLAATVATFALVMLRDGLGVQPPVWPAVWAKSYNVTELLGVVVCALRALHASGASAGGGLGCPWACSGSSPATSTTPSCSPQRTRRRSRRRRTRG